MPYQSGSLRRKRRKDGSEVWEFRFRDGKQIMRQKTFKVSEFPTASAVKIELQKLVFSLNAPAAMDKTTPFGLVMERFTVEERLREIMAQPAGHVTITDGLAYSTAKNYLSVLSKWLKPRWAEVAIQDIRPLDVTNWLKELPLAPLSKGRVKAAMHTLFERAMLWDILEIQRNPMDLVKLKGIGRRKKRKVILSVEQFQQLRERLAEPYKAMATLAICTGLRVSEVTALDWSHVEDGALTVQAGCVHGRIGAVKTEASFDAIPLHADILAGLEARAEGLIFQENGKPLSGSMIQNRILRPLGRELFGVDNLGWHSFRHTYRALLDAEPVGVQQKLMRHANVATTMNVYGETAMKDKRAANGKVVQMVIGRAS